MMEWCYYRYFMFFVVGRIYDFCGKMYQWFVLYICSYRYLLVICEKL